MEMRLTFDFVLADVDEGWWVYRVGGVVEDHLDRCRPVGTRSDNGMSLIEQILGGAYIESAFGREDDAL